LGTFWSADPLLVWGLFQRGIGLILLISFTSLAFQVVPGVGARSILPVARRLAQLRRDFPTWRRVLYFPSLLWITQKDWFLRALPITGMLASAAVIYGGPYSVWALGVCYVCYLSLDLAMALVLPWDTLLLETTVLALFLPATHALPSLGAVHAPAPALAWAFRLLLFRVMFGFGKQKFIGSRKQDLAYLKGFFLNQPLLSPGGWYAYRLPMWLLKLSVLFMFFVEIPAPFFAFVPGVLSVVCAVATIALMLGIQLTGNFGYFSLLTIVCAIPLFDNDTPRALQLTLFSPGEPVLTNAFVLVHTLAALGTFPFNSWLAQGWHLWAIWYQLPRWVQLPLNFYRWLHPFRWVHPYGVFPPNTTPGVKITLLAEVSWDNQTWHELRFAFAPSHPESAPRFVAPHHPRGEQAIIYDTFGMNYTSLMTTMIPAWDPSAFCMRSPSLMFCQQLLRTPPAQLPLADGELSRRQQPPVAARVTTVMLEALTIAEHRASGKWWKRTYIGPHVPPQTLDHEFDDDVLGHPELWHFDAIFWRRRSSLAPLMERARTGRDDPEQLALLGSDLGDEDVARFWHELVPMIAGSTRERFDNLPATVQAVRARFSRKQLRALNRLLGRFSLVLIAKLEPLYLHRGLSPQVPARTYFQLWMLVQHVIGCGRDAYLAAVDDPASISVHLAAMTHETGLFALCVFRFEEITFDAQKLRLLEQYFHPHDQVEKRRIHEQLKNEDMSNLSPIEQRIARIGRSVSGLYTLMPHIREAFRGPGFDHGYPELYPRFDELPDGEVRVGQYARLPDGVQLAPDIKSLP
jgi:hypothetical protein